MCLQLCLVRQVLIDNDLPCDAQGCPDSVRFAHTDKHCAQCQHCQPREAQAPLCGLTHESIPQVGYCCHFNVAAPEGDSITITPGQVAPMLWRFYGARQGHVPTLLQRGDVPYTLAENGAVVIRLEDLSLPFTYGISVDCAA